MPDWKKLVRKHLRSLTLSPCAQEQVIDEISDHLQGVYEDARRQGHSKRASLKLALQEVGDWRVLTRGIRRTKSEDASLNRTRALLMPTFVNLVLTSALLNICDKFGIADLTIKRSAPMPAFQPWLLTLPLCGALAALLARRADGPSTARFAAALAPCVVWFASLFVLKIIFLCLPGFFSGVSLSSLAFAAIGWVVLPGLALFAGAAPFLGTSGAKSEFE